MTKSELKKLGQQRADRVKQILKQYCTHTKGQWAGKPFSLIPWQEELIDKAFGTLKPDGLRQYRFVYVEIPKKNGKTELMAGLGIYFLVGDGEMGGEVYSAAADRDQASLTYLPMQQMVRNNKRLDERLEVIDSKRRIVDYTTGSFYQVLSSETFTKHGLNPSAVLFDELHAQPNRDLWDVLTSGTDYARQQQMIIVATTAGVYDPNSIWWEIREKAIKIKQGIIDDPSFLPILYIADKDRDDPEDEKVWARTNPSVNHIFTLDRIREDYQKSKQSVSDFNNFLRFRLNIPVQAITRWIMPEKWQACSFPVDIESLKGKVCYGGLDLSSNTDTTALVWVFPPQEGLYEDKFTVLARFFVPKDNLIERVRRDRVPYDVWEQQGYIVTTDGNIVDENFILAQIDQDTKDFDVRELCYDRWGASKIITALHDMGFENPQENKRAERRLIEFGQGVASMSPPSKELEKLILSQKLAHGGNPVLTWQISNVVIRTDPAGNIKPDKEKSRERIDGAVAMIMGLARAVLCNSEKSVYEERGILTI